MWTLYWFTLSDSKQMNMKKIDKVWCAFFNDCAYII